MFNFSPEKFDLVLCVRLQMLDSQSVCGQKKQKAFKQRIWLQYVAV